MFHFKFSFSYGCGFSYVLALAVQVCLTSPKAQNLSVAATLEQYSAIIPVLSVAGVTAKSFSGVAFQPESQSLYVVDNDNASVYVLTTSGVLQRTILTTGFLDPEGIVYQGGNSFLISEEGLANIVRITLPLSGTGPIPYSNGTVLNIGANMSNSGIEGVAYCEANQMAYAVKEISPTRLYRITLDESGKPLASFPDEPFILTGKTGDAADIWALNDGNFVVVNQEENKLEGYDAKGKLLSTLALGMNKPEGLAIDSTNGILYVVGEPNEFRIFKKAVTRIQNEKDRPISKRILAKEENIGITPLLTSEKFPMQFHNAMGISIPIH